MKNKNIALLFALLLIAAIGTVRVDAQDASATVDCKEIGRLNGEVQYQYEVTLNNRTDGKLIVEYEVILYAGSVQKKVHRHSTLLIPKERNLVETNTAIMRVEDWDRVTRFRVEWTSRAP